MIDEFYTPPKEVLHGNPLFIDLELDELKTEFIVEDPNTVRPPETSKNNEKGHKMK